MAIENVIIGKIVAHIVDKSIKYLSSIPASEVEKETATRELETALKNQLIKSQRFSSSLELFKYEDGRGLEESTIDLTISNSTRQSFKSFESSEKVSEDDLLLNSASQMILGDPGSGKTTTLKRLIDESIRRVFEEDNNSFPYAFPLFFKLAEIPPTECLFLFLSKNLGISYDTHAKQIEYEATEKKKIYDPESDYADDYGYYEEEHTITKTKTEYEYKVGNLDLDIAIIELINKQNTIIFLDGLDELHYQIREKVFTQIKKLLSTLNESKLVITSRYFEDVDSFKNIRKNEILPLSEKESIRIISQWSSEPSVFWKVLCKKPYKELAERPLFLFYLVMLFKSNKGILPEQGVDVYRQVVLLVLREWDEQKEYKAFRYSKIKDFDTYKKEEFIANIAFYLIYEVGVKKIFSHSDLTKAYGSIYRKYPQLSSNDANSVIKDIETDNALIITSYANEYEFTHLSLQEYLCAKHILSVPFSRKMYDYLSKNPEPLALAVALSPEPSGWFAMLVLNNINEPQHSRKLTPDIVYVFINRLISEGAVFDEPSIELGMAVLFIIFSCAYSKNTSHIISKFLENDVVLQATRRASTMFKVNYKEKTEIEVSRKFSVTSDLYLDFPEKGKLPTYLWKMLN